MEEYLTNTADLTTVANAIRAKGGISDPLVYPDGFVSAIQAVDLYHTYSDAGYVIRQDQTGEEYEDAIDVINAPYTYTETDKRVQDIVGIEDYTELRG